MRRIEFQDVLRDAVQSLFGTNPSAREIITAYPTAHRTGCASIQTGGGTFFDIFAKKGRDEWEEVETLISRFKGLGVRQSALFRGDFLLGYAPQPYDVVRAMIFEYAAMGMNIIQNFHGMNDARCLIGVARAVAEARKAGYDIEAQGTICIEENPNITIAGCLAFAEELVAMGHRGFYLKSASGRLRPDFTAELVTALYTRFPDMHITIHAHATYGEAPACYMAGAVAAAALDKSITMDVQHPALAGSTAHPSMLKMADLIRNHPDAAVKARVPEPDIAAIRESTTRLYGLRFRYRAYEASGNTTLVDAMYAARTPGGASATLKSIPGLVDTLGRLLGSPEKHADWNTIQIKIYEMQARILEDLGQPVQVTPYAANTTGQAALSLWHELEGRDRYHSLFPGIADYLAGRHGRVPPGANPALIKKALAQCGLDAPEEYIPSTERAPGLPQAEAALQQAGIEKPGIRQQISAALLRDSGQFRAINHIVECHNNYHSPESPPELPFYAMPPQPMQRPDGDYNRDVRDAVDLVGGYPALQEIAERAAHLRQIADRHYIFPEGEEDLERQWYENNVKKLAAILDSIPVLLEKAEFSPGQKMMMLNTEGANSIHAAIRDAVEHKGEGLYDFMMEQLGKAGEAGETQKADTPPPRPGD